MKIHTPTLQALLNWIVAEENGPTGWAVLDPATEVIRFAEAHGITLQEVQRERCNKNRLAFNTLRTRQSSIDSNKADMRELPSGTIVKRNPR